MQTLPALDYSLAPVPPGAPPASPPPDLPDPAPAPPAEADWEEIGEARHTFTHFHLRLTVLAAMADAEPTRGTFTDLDPKALPTLMRKVWALAAAAWPRVARDAGED